MTLILNSWESCRRSGGAPSGEGEGGEGRGGGARGACCRVGRVVGRGRLARGERCCTEVPDNTHTRGQAFRMA